MKTTKQTIVALLVAAFVLTPCLQKQLFACTGITLTAADGSVVFGRTLEWGTFDLNGRVIIIPRDHDFTGQTPDGKQGLTWRSKYGVAGIDVLGKEFLTDGVNEKGLVLGLFYHPGFAEYEKYVPANASESLGPLDVAQYLLTTCASVAEVRAALDKVHVVPVLEPAIGLAPPIHLMISEPTGKQIVIEFTKGKTTIVDAPLGVITNAPNYDWHTTNLRNYINLSPVALPDKKIEDLDFKPLGGGSGLIGLPGDFTPPSRFIRAVAFAKTARPVKDGPEATYEVFRILDNFNVPLGASEGSGDHDTQGMRSSTIWTVATDLSNKVIYYHTQHNRRVRKLDVGAIDFSSLPPGIKTSPLDKKKIQDIENIRSTAFTVASAAPTQRPVAVDLGPKAYRDGDVVHITHVTATSPQLEQGDTVTVRGRVQLKSAAQAKLCLYLTQTVGDGRSRTDASQTTLIKQGESEFELTTTIKNQGALHVTFYDSESGRPFGGVYFGTTEQMESIADWNVDYYLDD